MTTAGAENPAAAVIGELVEMLARVGVTDVALTGAQALGVWTVPRFTADLDACAVVPQGSVDRLLAQYDGVRVGPEALPSIIRIQFRGWQVDLFVAKSDYDRECLRRAVAATIGTTVVRVVTAEDLIIHKLHKLKADKRKLLQDAADLRLLATTVGTSLDQAYLRQWLDTADAQLAGELATLEESELVRRLAAR